jgi:hypothetical protein
LKKEDILDEFRLRFIDQWTFPSTEIAVFLAERNLPPPPDKPWVMRTTIFGDTFSKEGFYGQDETTGLTLFKIGIPDGYVPGDLLKETLKYSSVIVKMFRTWRNHSPELFPQAPYFNKQGSTGDGYYTSIVYIPFTFMEDSLNG